MHKHICNRFDSITREWEKQCKKKQKKKKYAENSDTKSLARQMNKNHWSKQCNWFAAIAFKLFPPFSSFIRSICFYILVPLLRRHRWFDCQYCFGWFSRSYALFVFGSIEWLQRRQRWIYCVRLFVQFSRVVVVALASICIFFYLSLVALLCFRFKRNLIKTKQNWNKAKKKEQNFSLRS